MSLEAQAFASAEAHSSVHAKRVQAAQAAVDVCAKQEADAVFELQRVIALVVQPPVRIVPPFAVSVTCEVSVSHIALGYAVSTSVPSCFNWVDDNRRSCCSVIVFCVSR